MENTENKLDIEFIKSAIYRIDINTQMIKMSIEKITENDLWKKPNGVSNSIGNLLLHLGGNIKQYIIASLGNEKDLRERDKEFSTKNEKNKEALSKELYQILNNAKLVINNVSSQNLLKTYKVQGFTLSGIGIIMHVVEHLSYHTGQIIFWTKILKSQSLGFYDGVDLNAKNEN